MTDEIPGNAELFRGLKSLSDRLDGRLNSVDQSLRELPTEKTLLALLATRDTEIRGIREEIKTLYAFHSKETKARQEQNKEDRDRLDQTRRFMFTSAIALIVGLVAVATFVLQVSGGPPL